MLGPVLMKFGSPEQQAEYLPRILDGTDWWCQGYSEPGAGSDLASLKTRAERDGDHYIVNGQKTWTTLGQYANRIFCLVRTKTDGKPQEGISFLLIDLDTPGIEMRPDPTDRRWLRGERGVLHRCPRAGHQPRRRGKRRLDDREIPAGP
jgi:alkylation response protein AidB-like acyl-CoA dehydrogenase